MDIKNHTIKQGPDTKFTHYGSNNNPASIQSRVTIGPPAKTPFGWRFAGGPTVVRFYVLTGKQKVKQKKMITNLEQIGTAATRVLYSILTKSLV